MVVLVFVLMIVAAIYAARKSIDVEKLAGEEVGVHAGLSFLAIAIESRESFWFGLVRGSEGRQKPECGCKKR